jgi:hypothetical protein
MTPLSEVFAPKSEGDGSYDRQTPWAGPKVIRKGRLPRERAFPSRMSTEFPPSMPAFGRWDQPERNSITRPDAGLRSTARARERPVLTAGHLRSKK